MADMFIKEALKQTSENLFTKWRQYNPTISQLNGGNGDNCGGNLIEDLSDESFFNQEQLLRQSEIKISAFPYHNQFEKGIINEILREIKLKRYLLLENPYLSHLRPYLQLISMAFLQYNNFNKDKMEIIMMNIIKNILFAKERDLTVNIEDIHFIGDINNYVKDMMEMNKLTEITGNSLIKLLSDFKVNKTPRKSSCNYLELINLDFLLREAYGTQKSAAEWLSIIKDEIYLEIDRLVMYENEKNCYFSKYKNKKVDNTLFISLLEDIIKTKQNYGYSLDGQVTFEVLPKLYNNITNEGFYIYGKEKKLYLSNRLSQQKNVVSKGFLAYLYIFLSHEIFPGHHYHLNSIKTPFIKRNVDFLQNPVSLEGFAVLSEKTINHLNFNYYVSLLNLKRLIPTAIYIEKLVNGIDKSHNLIENIFAQNPILLDEYKKNAGFGSPNIIYTIGYLETLNHFTKVSSLDFNKLAQYGPVTFKYFT